MAGRLQALGDGWYAVTVTVPSDGDAAEGPGAAADAEPELDVFAEGRPADGAQIVEGQADAEDSVYVSVHRRFVASLPLIFLLIS